MTSFSRLSSGAGLWPTFTPATNWPRRIDTAQPRGPVAPAEGERNDIEADQDDADTNAHTRPHVDVRYCHGEIKVIALG